jgi:hypothetical protein
VKAHVVVLAAGSVFLNLAIASFALRPAISHPGAERHPFCLATELENDVVFLRCRVAVKILGDA